MPIPVHFSSLTPKLLMFTLGHLLFDHFQFSLIHGPNIPGSYATLFFTAMDFHHQSHPQLGMFLLWLSLFILFGAVSPLSSSSIMGTYQAGELIFQCHTFLPFHTIRGVLRARVLKCVAIPFSSGLCFVRSLQMVTAAMKLKDTCSLEEKL